MNPWKRKGLHYIVKVEYNGGFCTMTVTRKLDFIAYHLIKWYHGEEKLIEMANKR